MRHGCREEPDSGLRSSIDEALAAHDKAAAVTLALDAVTSGAIGIPDLYDCVLAPVMTEVGTRWQHGTARVWEEHLAAAAVLTIVDALYPAVRRLAGEAEPIGRRVLLTCPPDEAHDLGLRMLADRFDLAGWTTFYLGADTPAAEIEDAAASLGVDLVVITSSTHFHRLRVRALLDDLKAALPNTRIVVGGPAFVADADGFDPAEILRAEEFFGRTAFPAQE